MDKVDLSNFPKFGEQMLFEDVVKDDLHVEKANLKTCRFLRVGAKNAVFQETSLTQCLFEDSYFRKAKLIKVDLTGSTFRNCNLEKAEFQDCNLRYCTFFNTNLDPQKIRKTLPEATNLKRDLARNLRKNFETLGDKESADIFLNIEIKAHEEELLNGFRGKTEYYINHYRGITQKFFALFKFLGSRLSGFVWGYGHRIQNLVLSYLILILLSAVITWVFSFSFRIEDQIAFRGLSFMESLYYTFTQSIGIEATDITPISRFAKTFQIVKGLFGTVFLALLAASLYRKITR